VEYNHFKLFLKRFKENYITACKCRSDCERLRTVCILTARYCFKKSRRRLLCCLSGMRFLVTKREKETTVCYKWFPWKWPKLVPHFIESHKLHMQRLESVWWLSVPKMIDIVSYLLKLFLKCNGTGFLNSACGTRFMWTNFNCTLWSDSTNWHQWMIDCCYNLFI